MGREKNKRTHGQGEILISLFLYSTIFIVLFLFHETNHQKQNNYENSVRYLFCINAVLVRQ